MIMLARSSERIVNPMRYTGLFCEVVLEISEVVMEADEINGRYKSLLVFCST